MAMWIVLLLSTISARAEIPGSHLIRFSELRELIETRNENVKAAQSTLSAQNERTGALVRSILPRLSARLGAEEFKSYSNPPNRLSYWRIEAFLNVYRGGRDGLEDDLRNSNVRRAEGELKLERNRELLEAQRTYWQLVGIKKLLVDRRDELARNEANLKSIRRRTGAGVASSADLAQFELQKTIIVQHVKRLELEEDVLKNRLSVALGRDAHEDIQVESEFPKPEARLSVTGLVPEKNAEVSVMRELENTERIRGSQANRWWHPRLDVYLNYGIPSLSEDYTRATWRETQWTGGVRLAFDLSDGLDARRDASAASFEADAIQLRTSHRARQVTAVDHELRHDLKIHYELIQDADRDVERAAQFLRLTESDYNRGVKNGPDLLGAVEKYFEIRMRRNELYRDYHVTRAELMALVTATE